MSISVKQLTGLGHCDGELAAYLTNNCGTKVACVVGFSNGSAKSETNVAAGSTVGGESGGLWTCNAAGGTASYRCSLPSDPFSCRSF